MVLLFYFIMVLCNQGPYLLLILLYYGTMQPSALFTSYRTTILLYYGTMQPSPHLNYL